MAVRDFPLFPLGIVALPTEAVPLHIFEDRYLRMIEHCLEHDAEFGIIWLSDARLHRTGCACRVEQVLERNEDGSVDILSRGTRPFVLLSRQDDLPYPAGEIEPAVDEPGEQHDIAAAAGARDLYRELVLQATDRELSEAELAELDSWRMAGTVEFELEDKQRLLELRSEDARLRLLGTLLAAALERLELIERAQVRAQSNGKVRFG